MVVNTDISTVVATSDWVVIFNQASILMAAQNSQLGRSWARYSKGAS